MAGGTIKVDTSESSEDDDPPESDSTGEIATSRPTKLTRRVFVAHRFITTIADSCQTGPSRYRDIRRLAVADSMQNTFWEVCVLWFAMSLSSNGRVGAWA